MFQFKVTVHSSPAVVDCDKHTLTRIHPSMNEPIYIAYIAVIGREAGCILDRLPVTGFLHLELINN